MNRLLEFIGNHPFLWLALVILIILVILEETKKSIKGLIKVSPPDVINLINHENAIVIDIRPEKEFKNGHLINARNISDITTEEHLKGLSKHKQDPMILIDSYGQNAINAGVKLRSKGFEKLYILDGGIDAWQKADMPLIKD